MYTVCMYDIFVKADVVCVDISVQHPFAYPASVSNNEAPNKFSAKI